jgi:hypothetical protein
MSIHSFHALSKETLVNRIASLEEQNNEFSSTVQKYAAAARVIHLHLKEFCDETLPYDQMIAKAARMAASSREEQLDTWGEKLRDAENLIIATHEHLLPLLRLFGESDDHPVMRAILDYVSAMQKP